MNSPPESRVMVKSGAALPVSNMNPKPRRASILPTQDDRRPPSRQSGVRRQSSESRRRDDTARLGNEIYERDVRSQVEDSPLWGDRGH